MKNLTWKINALAGGAGARTVAGAILAHSNLVAIEFETAAERRGALDHDILISNANLSQALTLSQARQAAAADGAPGRMPSLVVIIEGEEHDARWAREDAAAWQDAVRGIEHVRVRIVRPKPRRRDAQPTSAHIEGLDRLLEALERARQARRDA